MRQPGSCCGSTSGAADALEAAIATLDAEIAEQMEPFLAAAKRVTQIPGVGDIAATAIVSEIGVDMSRFPTVGDLSGWPSAADLISWAGLCPRNDQSAGKHRSRRLRDGAPWLKTILVQSAWAATRANGTYLQAQFRRLKSRCGPKKAIMAVAGSILTAVYYMLSRGTDYMDLGADHFQRSDRAKAASRLVRRLSELGYEVGELRDQHAA